MRVHAVEGNNDHGLLLPERLTVDVDGCVIAMVHDSGAAAGRAARLRRWFPDADVVVFGHSHLPWHETDVRPATATCSTTSTRARRCSAGGRRRARWPAW